MIRTRGVTGTIRFPLPLQVLGAALWLLVLSSVLVYGAMIAVTRLLDADKQRLLRRAVSQIGRLHP